MSTPPTRVLFILVDALSERKILSLCLGCVGIICADVTRVNHQTNEGPPSPWAPSGFTSISPIGSRGEGVEGQRFSAPEVGGQVFQKNKSGQDLIACNKRRLNSR
jgi:hypothetical protein